MQQLEELRVEVSKRECLRRFEAMRRQDARRGRHGGVGSFMWGVAGGGVASNFTTDHNGNVL